MKRLTAAALLVLLAACTPDQTDLRDGDVSHVAAAASDTLPDGAVCQIGPDGGPPLAGSPEVGSAVVRPAGGSKARVGQAGTDAAPGTLNPGGKPADSAQAAAKPVAAKPVAAKPVAARRVTTDGVARDAVPTGGVETGGLASGGLASGGLASDGVSGNRGLAQTILADRGIGGTGAPQAVAQLADRGIGGTGIVGVVTGFASVCVDGLEVAYDKSAVVDIDGSSGSPAALRVGQVVVIEAKGPAGSPTARSISVRRQVTGRIEAVELGTGTLTIAGQPVSVTTRTWGADTARLGDWVAVSGLRRTDGMLVATRLDQAPAGTLTVRGQVVRDGDTAQVGQLVLSGSAAAGLKTGQYVMVAGQYTAGRPQVHSVTADPLFANPGAYFGASVSHLVLQGYVHVANGAVYLNGLKVAAGPGVSAKPGGDGVAIVLLDRKGDEPFTATKVRYTGHAGPSPDKIQIPNSDSRAAPASPPQARRAVAALASLGGSGGGSVAGGQASVAGAAPGVSGLGVVSGASVSGSSGSGASVSGAAASTSSITIPTSTSPPLSVVRTVPPIISPAVPPVVTPAITPIIKPAGTGATTESLPGTPNTSQLMSSNTSGSGITALQASRVSRGTTVAQQHPAISASLASQATVSLATQAVTPAALAPATSVATPAVLAPVSSNAAGIKTIGTGLRNPGTSGGVVRAH